MDRFDLEDVVAPTAPSTESPLKDWRLKFQEGILQKEDLINFFQRDARKYFDDQYEFVKESAKLNLKCMFKEAGAKEGIIDVILEFILGDNPNLVLEKLCQEGNVSSVCGRVFKSGEPTYSCRECGMDPTCVLCVTCFKKSSHRYHKYKMATSCGGGCCDCGDEEAWKKDPFCEVHLQGKTTPPNSKIITTAMVERCEIAFVAILSFCVSYLEIEPNASLKCLDGDVENENSFCTVLYNDESHTFDQVIHTLIKIVKCRNKDANEIVGNIDREGRAVVRCDTFYECCQLKEAIEKQTVTVNASLPPRANQSLRVTVLHTSAIACQQFALQLLNWLQDFLSHHSMFRKVFCSVILDKEAPYRIRHILEYDVKLWKNARTCWHRLLISGMLMEYDNKMALAQAFSKHYPTIIQDFIRDDHEHSYSIVSLSVQLFTVPSIAHYLIANDSIYYRLLHTFYAEAVDKFVQNKTLHFTKNLANMGFFKRSSHILHDLRYILSFKPEVWAEDLRKGFLEGCKALLRLLNSMQGMESVKRQVGQHMDYEPEWEGAFNFHIKLSNTITLSIDWSGLDQDVLVKFYKMIMKQLFNNGFILSSCPKQEKTVAGHTANCFMYDVVSQPVSMHLPLTRLYAGVYLNLGKYDLDYHSIFMNEARKPDEIIEPILCTLAMIAQVNSGMWRRNGYSLLHQVFFYRNVRCRNEMLDRDIAGLQIGASLMDKNEFLIHILNKFHLIDWIQPYYEGTLNLPPLDDDFMRHTMMIDEFLELLITILAERHVPGISNVTEEDRIRKEIIQWLCIKSFSHSELNRALSDANNEIVLEDIIASVATFKKPIKSEARGVYELKDEYYDDFNMYFYHYTKEEKSKSEETQRSRRKDKGLLVCCPPPNLSKLTENFVPVTNLLDSDVMMTIMSTILSRGLDQDSKSFTDNHLQKVLYLIGIGIQEELSGNYPKLIFYERSLKFNILSMLQKLSKSPRVEAHRDFILWTIKKFKELQHMHSPDSEADEMQSDDIETAPGDSGENNSLTAMEKEKKEKEDRAKLAAERRAFIMAQMVNAQKSFMKSNAEIFGNTIAESEEQSPQCPSTSSSSIQMDWQAAIEEEGAVAYNSVACLGIERRLQQPEEQTMKCILCFEDCSVSSQGQTVVYSAYIQKSMVLPPEKGTSYSIYTSSCGHVMHSNCWQEYYNNEESKEQRRPHRLRIQSVPNSPNTEFQCPYCRCLSNTVLPLTEPFSKYSMPVVIHSVDEILPLDSFLEIMKTFLVELDKLITQNERAASSSDLPCWHTILKKAKLNVDLKQFENIAQPVDKQELPENWFIIMHNYIKVVNQNSFDASEYKDPEALLWMWRTCSYTIQAVNVYMRSTGKPFRNDMSIRHKSCLSGIIRASGLYSAYMTSDGERESTMFIVLNLLKDVFQHNGQSLLEWNSFNVMLMTIFAVPNLMFAESDTKVVISNGSIMNFYFLQVFFLAQIVKAIVLFKVPSGRESSMDVDNNDELFKQIRNVPQKLRNNIHEFFCKYNISARENVWVNMQGKDNNEQQQESIEMNDYNADPEVQPENVECDDYILCELLDDVRNQLHDFLRCCCLFFHFVTDVDFPDELITNCGDTFENMCTYLGLDSNLSNYFDNESSFPTILEMFASHPDIKNFNFGSKFKKDGGILNFVQCTNATPKLVDLPEDYSDLINSVSDLICPNNEHEEMKSPTMCLICGQILCGHSYCCQPELQQRCVGACTYHAHFCGAEIGPFLRIRDCQIFYLGRNKGCFVPPPYLDEYGETDQYLRRGNPLRLCKERYDKINLAWLGHGLHEEIARLNDVSIPSTQWHHM